MSLLEFRGVHAEILADTTPERLIEGSLSSGKTTVALYDEFDAIRDHPGIWILITRWTDDAVKTLLRPAFEQMARIRGVTHTFNREENSYEMANGSRVFAFGLKTQSQDPLQKYSKIRGLPVSRILFDQAEQGQSDTFSELRFRLRPDLEARSKGITYPTQLTMVANPVPDSHALATEFPVSNKIKGRKHFALSLFSNRHNLPETMVESLLAQYPPSHPLYATRILGERGLTITGDPIYENLFDRALHVKALESEGRAFLEAFEFGKHNPVWLLAQRTPHGSLHLLGGVMGKRLMLEDFLPVVKRYRQEWTGEGATVQTCIAPMGHDGVSPRYTLDKLLRDAGYRPVSRDTANAPNVQLAMIESISMALRRRTTIREEALSLNVDPARWVLAFPDGTETLRPFLSFAFDGGYVWSPHMVSVANKEMRQPFADDEYANAMRCVENLMLNFCAGQPSEQEREDRLRKARSTQGGGAAPPASPLSWMGS